jgi:hypothetical protein
VTIYQFQRESAFLQAVSVPTGEVVSYGVYATVADFNPQFETAGVILNRSLIYQPSTGGLGAADQANAYCGANRAGLWLSFGTSNALDNRTFVLGVYSTDGFEIRVDRLCQLLFSDESLHDCIPYLENDVTRDAAACLEASQGMVELLRDQAVSVCIETSPGRALASEMLHTPDVAAVLRD